MNCPACKNAMITLELADVEIDHCVHCGGIWLDGGELELLMDAPQKARELLDSFREDPATPNSPGNARSATRRWPRSSSDRRIRPCESIDAAATMDCGSIAENSRTSSAGANWTRKAGFCGCWPTCSAGIRVRPPRSHNRDNHHRRYSPAACALPLLGGFGRESRFRTAHHRRLRRRHGRLSHVSDPCPDRHPRRHAPGFLRRTQERPSDTGDIDLLVKRSVDGGKTWGPQQVVWDDGANTCGNPCPVVDQTTGTIWLPMTWNHGKDTEKPDQAKHRQRHPAGIRHAQRR